MTPLYKVELIVTENEHHYSIDQSTSFVPGVTTALSVFAKHALVPWSAKQTALYLIKKVRGIVESSRFDKNRLNENFWDILFLRSKKQHRFIKENAARLGSLAHLVMSEHFRGVVETERKEVKGFLDSFIFWLHNHAKGIEIVESELLVGSKKYFYGGTIDMLAKDASGKFIIIDFKTGKSIWPEHAYQVAAYAKAFQEQFDVPYLPEAYILKFEGDKVGFERRRIANVEHSFDVFAHLLDVYKAQKETVFSEKELIRRDEIKKRRKTNAAA